MSAVELNRVIHWWGWCVFICMQAWLTSRASTVGDDLQVVKQDQLIKSNPSDYKRRRTIAIQRAHGGSCGFTLQVTYILTNYIRTIHTHTHTLPTTDCIVRNVQKLRHSLSQQMIVKTLDYCYSSSVLWHIKMHPICVHPGLCSGPVWAFPDYLLGWE